MKEDPDLRAWAEYHVGYGLGNQHRYQEAISRYEAALEIDPKFASAWFQKGAMLVGLEQLEEAIISFNHALEIDPKNKDAWCFKGVVLALLKRKEEALTCYDHALEIDPTLASIWRDKGMALQGLGKSTEAIICYDHALEVDPKDAKAWSHKGDSLRSCGQYEEAIVSYDHALEVDPNDAFVWYFKGSSLEYLKRFSEALICYQKAHELGQTEAVWGIDSCQQRLRERAIPSLNQDLNSVPMKVTSMKSDASLSKPLAPMNSKIPDPVPETCGRCQYLKRSKNRFLDIFSVEGYCTFYEMKRAKGLMCHAYDLIEGNEGDEHEAPITKSGQKVLAGKTPTMKVHPAGTIIVDEIETVQGPNENPRLAGSMGVVYLCIDHGNNQRPLALKAIKPSLLHDKAKLETFLDEGSIWVQLGRQPHIVRCYQVLKLEETLEVYFVLEHVASARGGPDPSLKALLVGGGLPLKPALIFGLQIVRGMESATNKFPNLVHRDLKPGNILVGTGGTVMITDFGLANAMPESSTGGFVAPHRYASPEQRSGHTLDARADIYAFGCILYEMLTGNMVARSIEKTHTDENKCNFPATVPDIVRKIVLRCLAVNREKRYSNWTDLKQSVESAFCELLGGKTPRHFTSSEETRSERLSRGHSFNVLGATYLEQEKTDTAVEYFEKALSIGDIEKDFKLMEYCLRNLAQVQFILSDSTKARRYLEKAEEALNKKSSLEGPLPPKKREGEFILQDHPQLKDDKPSHHSAFNRINLLTGGKITRFYNEAQIKSALAGDWPRPLGILKGEDQFVPPTFVFVWTMPDEWYSQLKEIRNLNLQVRFVPTSQFPMLWLLFGIDDGTVNENGNLHPFIGEFNFCCISDEMRIVLFELVNCEELELYIYDGKSQKLRQFNTAVDNTQQRAILNEIEACWNSLNDYERLTTSSWQAGQDIIVNAFAGGGAPLKGSNLAQQLYQRRATYDPSPLEECWWTYLQYTEKSSGIRKK